MFERFTDRARKVMALANQEAQRFNHEYIGTEHILLGLVKEGSGVGANVLKNLDVDLRKVRLEVEKLVKSGPEVVTMGKLPQTPRAKKVIEYAIEEARNLNHNYVGTEHLLLGLLREHDGVAAQVLMNLGLKLDEVREEVLNLLGAGVEGGGTRGGPAAERPRASRPEGRQEQDAGARQRSAAT
jgi:ATP-dependent Clp protease ATP-binding subunit ClpC